MIADHAMFGVIQVRQAVGHCCRMPSLKICWKSSLNDGFDARHLFGTGDPILFAGGDEFGPANESQFPRKQVESLV